MKCPSCFTDNKKSFAINVQDKREKECYVVRCTNCGLIYLKDNPPNTETLYNEEYLIGSKSEEPIEYYIEKSKKKNFNIQLQILLKYINPFSKKLLDIGTGKGYLLQIASQMGFDCYGLEVSRYAAQKAEEKFPGRIYNGTLEEARYNDDQFDVITMTDLIEHIQSPISFFQEVNRIIKPNGLILITTPDTDSFTRKIMGKTWFQFKLEHATYWNKRSLEFVMNHFNFDILKIKKAKKVLGLLYCYHYFKKYPALGIGKMLSFLYKLSHGFFEKTYFAIPFTGELVLIAKSRKG